MIGAAMENGYVGALDAYMLHPIGVVRSELVDRANAPRQGDEGAPDATIEIVPAAHAGLDGIQEGQELIVLTWLHEAQRDVSQCIRETTSTGRSPASSAPDRQTVRTRSVCTE